MGRRNNLLGQRFAYWEVVGPTQKDKNGHIKWLCRCECGVERYVNASSLKCGKSSSCGCKRDEKIRLDLSNKSFGSWKVVGPQRKGTDGGMEWLCKCECGTEKYVRAALLNSGGSFSCGCKRTEKRRLDLSGRQFGAWKVIGSWRKGKNGRSEWLCKCSCGTVKYVDTASLNGNNSTSCGCARRKKK